MLLSSRHEANIQPHNWICNLYFINNTIKTPILYRNNTVNLLLKPRINGLTFREAKKQSFLSKVSKSGLKSLRIIQGSESCGRTSNACCVIATISAGRQLRRRRLAGSRAAIAPYEFCPINISLEATRWQ